MRSTLRRALFGLAVVLAISSAAVASPINYSDLLILSPAFGFGFGDATASSSSTDGGYSFSGEFCVNEDCSTGAIPTSATSLLRLTNMTLTCISESTCAPVDVAFEAQGASAPVGLMNLNVNLTGGGSAIGYTRVCISDSNNLCTPELFGNVSTSFPFAFSVSGGSTGAFFSNGSFDLLGDFHVNGLASGASVTLSNSLDIGITQVGAGAVPEPAALSLLPLGLAALALLRRKSNS
jgi:hypothetical protein